MMRHNSPKSIALRAGIVALLVCFFTTLPVYLTYSYSLFLFCIAPVFVGAAVAFSTYYFIYSLIYRKIITIHESIHRLKATRTGSKSFLYPDNDILEDVKRQVLEWAKDKSNEIEQLKAMDEYRREFLGNVAHELKTPIFTIQGYVHTLIDGALDDENVNRNYLYKAAKNIDRLINIVEDLDMISKYESSELQLEIRKFDFTELLREVIDSLEPQADLSDIKLRIKEGDDRPWFVFADRERTQQVLVNLLTNSIRYGKEKGRTIVGIEDKDEHILIHVTDNGIGIEPHHLTRLFERFYRVDKSRSRAIGGTGLGLSIVKHILEAHGQDITVVSTPGEGSTFTFSLAKART